MFRQVRQRMCGRCNVRGGRHGKAPEGTKAREGEGCWPGHLVGVVRKALLRVERDREALGRYCHKDAP